MGFCYVFFVFLVSLFVCFFFLAKKKTFYYLLEVNWDWSIQQIFREANMAADTLPKRGHCSRNTCIWFSNFPLDILLRLVIRRALGYKTSGKKRVQKLDFSRTSTIKLEVSPWQFAASIGFNFVLLYYNIGFGKLKNEPTNKRTKHIQYCVKLFREKYWLII